MVLDTARMNMNTAITGRIGPGKSTLAYGHAQTGLLGRPTDYTNATLTKREAQLKDAEAKYRGIFDNAVEGIYQSTPDGRYLTVNAALARLYGYDQPEELINQV